MAYSEQVAERVRPIVAGEPGLTEKKMFGGLAFLLDGNMACGVSGDSLIVRVGPEAYPNAVLRPAARPFDLTGRPMKGWVMVDEAGMETANELQAWVQEGIAFARSLPAK